LEHLCSEGELAMKSLKYVSILIPLSGLILLATPACSSDSPATARVSLQSYLGAGSLPGVNDSTVCSFAADSTWILIGDPTNQTSVSDGDTDSATGNTVSVTCKVYPETDGFHVEASAKLGVQGAVTVSGHFTANTGDSTLVLQNIAADFSRSDTGSFTESNCTATYTSNPQYEGVASGRIWADVDCPTATYASQSKTCEGKATFKFENCAMSP
jgi:hypothetical protein